METKLRGVASVMTERWGSEAQKGVSGESSAQVRTEVYWGGKVWVEM